MRTDEDVSRAVQELRARIQTAQVASGILEPSADERQGWQTCVDQAVSDFIGTLATVRTFSPGSSEATEAFDRQVAVSETPQDLFRAVRDGVAGSGLLTAGPGHLAFVPGGGLYLGAVADHMAAALNPFSADGFAAPVAAHIHNQAVRWLCDVVGYGSEAYGDLTSGGTHATLTAFHVARQVTQVKSQDIPSLCVYVGEHTHHCCHKALDVLFGDEIQIRAVPSRRQAMDPAALARCIAEDRSAGLKPWMVVATAGSTNLGRVDPLADLGQVAREHGLWFHIDAAYGGFFALLPEFREKFCGLGEADSIVLDPHKGMFLPYGTGAVLVKKGGQLRQHSTGSYLQDREVAPDPSPSPMDYSLELTRPFRALRLWMAQKVYGPNTFAAALREKSLLAQYCSEELALIPGIILVAEPDLSILAFRLGSQERGSDDLTMRLLSRINAHPGAFLSSTKVDGKMVIRVAVLSFRTHIETIDQLLATIRLEASKITLEGQRP